MSLTGAEVNVISNMHYFVRTEPLWAAFHWWKVGYFFQLLFCIVRASDPISSPKPFPTDIRRAFLPLGGEVGAFPDSLF